MVDNLISVLQQNHTLLGDHYQNVGKKVGNQKVFLAYDKKVGWNVVKLNPLQLFFRNVFGFYKNTHLKHVFKCLSDEKREQEVTASPFYSRMAKIWSEKCLKWVGNASASNARVICFGEEHGDHAYRAAMQQFINENYREGDVVLIEGVKAGEVVKRDHQMVNGLKENCLVMGFEPENFKEINKTADSEAHDAKYKEVEGLAEKFKTTFTEDCRFNPEELAQLRKMLDEIGNKVLELNKYYKSKDSKVVHVKELFSDLLKEVEEKKIENPRHTILNILTLTLIELEKAQEIARHENLSPEAQKLLLKNAPVRNVSLIHEISQYQAAGKRIFLIAGMAHFIQTPDMDENKVKKELAKYQFAVIGRKNILAKYARFNRDIQKL